MRKLAVGLGIAGVAAFGTPPATAGTLRIITKCPPDAVLVGQTCVDKYEASVWQIPTTNTGLINRVQRGKATLAELTAGGATQISPASTSACIGTEYPLSFPASGNWTAPVYAASIPGVLPSTCTTWFQAEQACALSRKRLLNNQEWQRAAAGTPDPGLLDNGVTTCTTNSLNPAISGARTNCKSVWGTFDTVGNVEEWVADWGDVNTTSCTNWPADHGSDVACVGGGGGNLPGTPVRGGAWDDGTNAGVFATSVNASPTGSSNSLGFRCGR